MKKRNEYCLTGLLPDPRSEEEKQNDFQHHEVSAGMYGATPLLWLEKEKDQWKKYSSRDQDGSSSCVGQGSAKGLETIIGTVISAHPIYRNRANFPSAGMWLADAGKILLNIGTTTEEKSPSQNMSEAEMNKDVTVLTPLKVRNYLFVNPKDIDAIAQVVQDHKHCIVTFESNYDEWIDVPKVKGVVKWGHCVCVVDYIMYKGEKALVIEDSWGGHTAIEGRRIITETFLKARCTGAMYLIFDTTLKPNKPKVNFKKALVYGMIGNDVVYLQNMLKYEGYFPATTQSTGFFGNMTAYGLKQWQLEHGILDFVNEKSLSKIRFGDKSIKLANTLYK